ncbi:MAG: hypothetical protein LBB88_02230, partial [Planctomycetaceae bacterium]|nr:hypothetical protein [Planctomycetaceae bacterium]
MNQVSTSTLSSSVLSSLPLFELIRSKSAKVGIIGLGYVGLPLVRAFINAGFKTLGFDVDQKKIDL